MSEIEQQIQGIRIAEANIGEVEAEVKFLKAIENETCQIDEYNILGSGLYKTWIEVNGRSIRADLYITDDPHSDIEQTKSVLRQSVEKRQELLDDPNGRNDLMRALVLQDKIEYLLNELEVKKKLLNLQNPVLEGDRPEVVSKMI